MLQTTSVYSNVAWNDAIYSNWCPIFTLIFLVLRIVLVIIHRKLYSRPTGVILFTTVKFLMDYFMFEGVERFSNFSERTNLQIISCIEFFYVIMSNFMIYSVFYADYALPLKVIIQFSALNIISIVAAMALMIETEDLLFDLSTVVVLHVIGILLYLDKSLALLKCDIYNSLGKTLIHLTIFFKLLFDHVLRIFYYSNLLLNYFEASIFRDRCLYFMQLFSTFIMISMFILYRQNNSDCLGDVFVNAKKVNSTKGTDSEFIFENAAEELMFPAENELNTISDIASDDDCDLDLEAELADQAEDEGREDGTSGKEPTVFATVESGRSRRHEHRYQIIRRTLNKVTSVE